MSKLSRLFKKKKSKPKPPAPTTPTGIPLAPIHREPPAPVVEQLPAHESDVAPLVHQIPFYGGDRGVQREIRANGDYEQYDIGNAEYASQLRDSFSLTGPSRFALASEIVPVAAFVMGSEASEGTRWHAGATILPAAGQFPMVKVIHGGSGGKIIIDRIRIIHVNQVALTASRPATTADNAVTVTQLEQGDVSGLSVRAQSAGGGLTASDIFQFTGEQDDGTPWQEINLEIYPGGDIMFFGSSAATFLGIHLYGRVITG